MARLPWGSQVLPEAAAARTESGPPPKRLQLYEFGKSNYWSTVKIDMVLQACFVSRFRFLRLIVAVLLCL